MDFAMFVLYRKQRQNNATLKATKINDDCLYFFWESIDV